MPEREELIKKLVGDSPTKNDFVKAFKTVVTHVLKFEKKLETMFASHVQEMSSSFANIEQRLMAQFQTLQRGRDGKDGVDGKDGKDGKWGKDGKDGSPDNGEQIIDKVNADKSKKRIKKEKVEGLADIEEMAKTARANSFGLRAAGDTVYLADISDQTDGSTKTFTIPVTRRAIMVVMSDFPNFAFSGNGFSVAGTTLTLTLDNAPSSGSYLALLYVV